MRQSARQEPEAAGAASLSSANQPVKKAEVSEARFDRKLTSHGKNLRSIGWNRAPITAVPHPQ
jgi:hypothetical protein